MRGKHPVRSQSGFSLVELMIVMVIILIIAAIAIPNIGRALRDYRLSNAATDVSNLLQQARYTAVRLNRDVTARATCPGVLPVQVWIELNNPPDGFTPGGVDLDGDGVAETQETLVVLPNEVVFAPAGAPGPASMGAFYAATATVPNCGIGAGAGITYDSRGVVDYGPGNPPVVFFMTVGYNNAPQWGFRAITVIPSGKSKTWKGVQGGQWVDR